MNKKVSILFCMCIAFCAFTGCNNNSKVTGKVTFSDNGEPLTFGTVCFVSDTKVGRGNIDKNGFYQMGFEKEKNGIPKGTYAVYIDGAKVEDGVYEEVSSTGTVSSRPMYMHVIDKKFTNASTSNLSCTVDKGTVTYNFEVERP
ncbi:MAG: hypothetical protein ACRC2T_12130 [Thermoguttaceae bacterium]